MPIIVIENYKPGKNPSGEDIGLDGRRFEAMWKGHVRKAMAEAVLAEKVPGITERHQVTTLFGERFDGDCPPDQRNPQLAVIFVEGFYDWPDRTFGMRQRLAIALGATLRTFLAEGWNVEVLPKRYNPEKEGRVLIAANGRVNTS